MTGAEKIKNKILDDAKKAAEINIEKAKEEASIVIKQRNEDATNQRNQIIEKAHKDAARLKERMIAVAQLEGRKKELQTKQEVIEEAFDKALQAIVSLPNKEYQNLIEKIAVEIIGTGKEEIVLSKNDKTRVDANFIQNINNKIKAKGLKPEIKLSSSTANISGGFLLKKGDVEINSSFETILKKKKERLRTY